MTSAPLLSKLCTEHKRGASSVRCVELAQAGVDFESIWAWEATRQDPVEYWDLVPDTYKQR